MRIFKVGDKVEAFGVRGVITNVLALDCGVSVEFAGLVYPEYFDLNGKYRTWHAEPSLKLIEVEASPDKIDQKLTEARYPLIVYPALYRWAGTETLFLSSCLFKNEDEAKKYCFKGAIFVKLLKNQAVEVD